MGELEALKFHLHGKTAFLKNPEVNTYFYFTYGQIHKPALLGLFGAVLGYGGYEKKYETYPEYYEKLKQLRISVIPESKNGYFSKKMQYFNNSVGYASKEAGGNLIVKEQWMENPSWTIYVMLEDCESRKLAEMLLENRCIYMPYLGKNDHPAVMDHVGIVELKRIDGKEEPIHSLIPAKSVIFDWGESDFKYEEYLPIALKQSTNMYELEKFIYTDALVKEMSGNLYHDGEKNIAFY